MEFSGWRCLDELVGYHDYESSEVYVYNNCSINVRPENIFPTGYRCKASPRCFVPRTHHLNVPCSAGGRQSSAVERVQWCNCGHVPGPAIYPLFITLLT